MDVRNAAGASRNWLARAPEDQGTRWRSSHAGLESRDVWMSAMQQALQGTGLQEHQKIKGHDGEVVMQDWSHGMCGCPHCGRRLKGFLACNGTRLGASAEGKR